eukprot:Nk52_evm53s2531 gene=Nk52_evmTU53s2531
MPVLIYLCQSYCTCTESGTASYIDPISGANVTVNMYSVAVCLNLPRDLNSQYLLMPNDPFAQADTITMPCSRLVSMGNFFVNYPLLRTLNLDGNAELVFDSHTFDGLADLTHFSALAIPYNGIKNANFESMYKLENMQISSALPESFDFVVHPNLKNLQSSGTQSDDFKNICIGGRDSLETLSLTGNSSASVLAKPFQENCFSNFTKLQHVFITELDIEGSALMNSRALTSVNVASSNAGPEEFHALYSLPKLDTLVLTNTRCSGLPLTAMPFPNEFIEMARVLVSFKLSEAPITELPPLPTNSSIRSIVVENTLLSKISLSQLATLPNLTQAWFSGNNISIVEGRDELPFTSNSCNGIESTSPLLELDLSGNINIRDFPRSLGCWFPDLQSLNFHNTSLSVVYFDGNFTQLNSIKLGENNITNIQFSPSSTIRYASHVGQLSIQGNSLESLPPQFFGIEDVDGSTIIVEIFNASANHLGKSTDPFKGASCNILSLDVSRNEISDLSPFVALSPNVTYIYASHNNLDYVSVDSPSSPGADLSIFLDYNNFSRCEDIVVTPDRFLTKISASNNRITYLNASCFGKDAAYLDTEAMGVDFSYNRLTTVDPYTFANLSRLQKIDISGNQLNTIQENTVFNCSGDSGLGVEFQASNNLLKTFDPMSVFSGGTFISKLYLDDNKLSAFPRYNVSLKNFKQADIASPTLISLTGNVNLTFTPDDCPLGIDVNELAPQYVQILDLGNTNLYSDMVDNILGCNAFSWLFLEDNAIEYISTPLSSHAEIYVLLLDRNALMKGLPHNFTRIFPKLNLVNFPEMPCENIGMDNMDLLRNHTSRVVDKQTLLDSAFSPENANGASVSAPVYYSRLVRFSYDVDEAHYCLLGGERVSFLEAYDYYTYNNVSFICQNRLNPTSNSQPIVPVVCAAEGGQCVASGNGRDYCICESGYNGDGYICRSTGLVNTSGSFNAAIFFLVIGAVLGIYISTCLFAILCLITRGIVGEMWKLGSACGTDRRLSWSLFSGRGNFCYDKDFKCAFEIIGGNILEGENGGDHIYDMPPVVDDNGYYPYFTGDDFGSTEPSSYVVFK